MIEVLFQQGDVSLIRANKHDRIVVDHILDTCRDRMSINDKVITFQGTTLITVENFFPVSATASTLFHARPDYPRSFPMMGQINPNRFYRAVMVKTELKSEPFVGSLDKVITFENEILIPNFYVGHSVQNSHGWIVSLEELAIHIAEITKTNNNPGNIVSGFRDQNGNLFRVVYDTRSLAVSSITDMATEASLTSKTAFRYGIPNFEVVVGQMIPPEFL